MILSSAPALQPPLPPMAAVGGSGVVLARVAALNAATGAVGGAGTFPVVSRTFPVVARATTVDADMLTIWYSGVAIRAPRSRTTSLEIVP